MSKLPGNIARRAFLQRAGQLGIAGVAAPWALNLAAMGEAAAQSATDYKALVCLFLYGGNDNGNTVIPYDTASHAAYLIARGGDGGAVSLGVPRDKLTGLSAAGLSGGQQFALAPELSELTSLYESGQLAVQMNVGPLVRPITLDEYKRPGDRSHLPPKLFSHNDQQSVWQSSAAEGATEGWGGKLGDLLLSQNGNSSTFTCLSISGNAVYLAGANALQYQLGTSGAIAINAATERRHMYDGSEACRAALEKLITESRTHVLENELNKITKRSRDAQQALSAALAPSATQFDAVLPNTGNLPNEQGAMVERGLSLNRQFKMVARMIAAQRELGVKRQVFMVSIGGFDNHDYLRARHPALLRQVSLALSGFQKALESIGMASNVTTFTASEFGRTITSNGDGSDHGWGSHHFVMGGAVKGKAFYGTAPSQITGGPEDVGQGRYIPSTSVDQYAATMARWFGVSDSNMPLIAPHIGNFSNRYLGFMGA